MFVRLSVVTPPKTPALAALRQVRAAAREAADRPGIGSARGSHVRRVPPDTRFAFTLARVGVMLWSDERTALDEEMAAVDWRAKRMSVGTSGCRWRACMAPGPAFHHSREPSHHSIPTNRP